MHILSPVTNNSPGFLNQRKGENDCRNDFMINLHGNYLAKLGFELVTPGSVVRHAKDWARKPSSAHKKSLAEALNWVPTTKEKNYFPDTLSYLVLWILWIIAENVNTLITLSIGTVSSWANSVDPDQMPQNAASYQGQHCLPLTLAVLDTLEIQYIAVRYFAISSISRIVRGPQIYHDHKKKK